MWKLEIDELMKKKKNFLSRLITNESRRWFRTLIRLHVASLDINGS